jgi:hypothetical protein
MKRALILIGAAAVCIAVAGAVIGHVMHLAYGHGVYCALGMAATEGCDTTPATGAARIVSAAVLVVCIPLFAAAYGSLMSAHLRKHMDLHRRAAVAQLREELSVVRKHITDTSAEMHSALDKHAQDLLDRADAHHEALKAHVTAATAPPAPAAAVSEVSEPSAAVPESPPAAGVPKPPRRPGRNT